VENTSDICGIGGIAMETDEIQSQFESTFDRTNAMVNQVFFSMPTVIALYAIAKYKPRKLPVFLAGNVALYTVMRRFACARCQYYGRPCSTMLGIMTAKIMPRDESKKLDRNGITADIAIILALGFYAMPQTNKSLKLALVYQASIVAAVGAILFNGCGKCGNDFCPMKDLRKAITKDNNK
jgi:hypothetical protein